MFYLMMSTTRMKMAREGTRGKNLARGGTRGKSSGSFMRECITSVLGLGMGAFDAHFATKSFMTHIKVFWRMQEDEPLTHSGRSILAGWHTPHTQSTRSSFTILQAFRRMRCGIELYMATTRRKLIDRILALTLPGVAALLLLNSSAGRKQAL